MGCLIVFLLVLILFALIFGASVVVSIGKIMLVLFGLAVCVFIGIYLARRG